MRSLFTSARHHPRTSLAGLVAMLSLAGGFAGLRHTGQWWPVVAGALGFALAVLVGFGHAADGAPATPRSRGSAAGMAALVLLVCLLPATGRAVTTITGSAGAQVNAQASAPSAGDFITGSSIQVPVQSLANDLAFFRDAATVTNIYATPGTVTWTAPTAASANATVCVDILGAGGGGGGGAANNATNLSGGSPGGGGGRVKFCYPLAAFAGNETVVIGQGGTGGPGAASNPSAGSDGTAGGQSCFSTICAAGGGLGSRGTTSNGTAGAGGTGADGSGGTGTSATTGAGAQAPPSATTGAGAGGTGAGVTIAAGVFAGGAGQQWLGAALSGGAGLSGGGSGGLGGGNFGLPGGGGGGGGSATGGGGTNGGAGGNGGNGRVTVTVHLF